MRTGARAARAVVLVAILALTCDSASAIRPAGGRPSGTRGPTTDADSGAPAAVGSVDDAASTAEASSEPQPEPVPAPASDAPVTSDAAPKIAMPARYEDAGFAEVGGDAASLRRTPLPGCALHVFRHVSKAAGTTMRFIFDKQVAMGEWEFLPMCHYGFRENDWRETVRRFREAAVDPERVASGRGPRIIVEVRNEWGATEAFENVIMKDLRELREHTAAVGCEVTSSLLFREPEAQYRSFHAYYIEKLRVGTKPEEGPERWGDSFAEWAAHQPDIQLRELLGDRCTPRLRDPPFDTRAGEGSDGAVVRVGPRPLPEMCKISLGDRGRFERLVADVDVVGVTDRFDLFWLQLADVVGFQHLEYSPSNARRGVDENGGKKEDDARRAGAAAVAESAPNDAWAYGIVRAAQEERTRCEEGNVAAKTGCDARRRLEAYAALEKRRADGGRRIGGEGPTSKFKFVDAEPTREGHAPREAWVRPDFYTGAPICKGFWSEYDALVKREDERYKCDRGCSFD